MMIRLPSKIKITIQDKEGEIKLQSYLLQIHFSTSIAVLLCSKKLQ